MCPTSVNIVILNNKQEPAYDEKLIWDGMSSYRADKGRYWQILADIGRYWQILVDFGRYWQIW